MLESRMTKTILIKTMLTQTTNKWSIMKQTKIVLKRSWRQNESQMVTKMRFRHTSLLQDLIAKYSEKEIDSDIWPEKMEELLCDKEF